MSYFVHYFGVTSFDCFLFQFILSTFIRRKIINSKKESYHPWANQGEESEAETETIK